MKSKYIYIIILILISFTGFIHSQNNNDKTINEKLYTIDELNLGFTYDYSIKQDYDDAISKQNEGEKENSNEYAIRKKITEFIQNENYEKAEELYLRLIDLFPRKDNYILYASFLARRQRYAEADTMFRKAVSDLSEFYRSLEDYYIKFKMFDELLTLYMDIYRLSEFPDFYLSKKIIKMYDVLNKENHRKDFIKELLISDSEVIFINTLSNIVNEIKNEEEIDNRIYINMLIDLTKEEMLNKTRKMEIKKKLGEIYFNKREYEKSYSVYRELIITYFTLLNDKLITQFKIQTTLNKFIGEFLSVREYGILINIYQIIISKIEKIDQDIFIDYYYRLAQTLKLNQELNYSLEKYYELKYCIEKIKKDDEFLTIGDLRAYNLILNKINYDIADILYQLRDFEKAIYHIDEITYPDRFNDHFLLKGKCYLAMGMLEKSQESLLTSYKNYSIQNSVQSLYYLSIVAILKEQKIKSLNYIENIIINIKSDEGQLAKEALLRYEIILSIINSEKRFNDYIKFERLLHTYQYEKLINIGLNNYKEYFNFDLEENPYYIFTLINILEKERELDNAIRILDELISKDGIKQRAKGFYYQKAVFLKARLVLENELKISKNIFETIKKYLNQLLIEYPETIYLNKIKKILNIGLEDNEKNKN